MTLTQQMNLLTYFLLALTLVTGNSLAVPQAAVNAVGLPWLRNGFLMLI